MHVSLFAGIFWCKKRKKRKLLVFWLGHWEQVNAEAHTGVRHGCMHSQHVCMHAACVHACSMYYYVAGELSLYMRCRLFLVSGHPHELSH